MFLNWNIFSVIRFTTVSMIKLYCLHRSLKIPRTIFSHKVTIATNKFFTITENIKCVAVLKIETSFSRRSLKIRRKRFFVRKVARVQSIDNFSSRIQMLFSSAPKKKDSQYHVLFFSFSFLALINAKDRSRATKYIFSSMWPTKDRIVYHWH